MKENLEGPKKMMCMNDQDTSSERGEHRPAERPGRGCHSKGGVSPDRLLGFSRPLRTIMRLLAGFNIWKSLFLHILALTGICNCQGACVLLCSVAHAAPGGKAAGEGRRLGARASWVASGPRPSPASC